MQRDTLNDDQNSDVRVEETYHAVIEGIADPVEERDRGEKVILLSQLIQLRIPIEHSRRDELVEDTNDEWRENGEDHIVESHGPAFKRDLTGEVIEPGVLSEPSARANCVS